MPTPERKPGQTSWARRQQQHQQQQHNSPFRRARHDPLHLDASFSPSPPRESPARHRRNFSQTGTLRGAFEFTSRLPFSENGEDVFLPQSTRRVSPRKRRSSSAMSLHSNPPELDEAYKQIEDANSLTDFDASDEEKALYRSNSDKFNRRLPSTTSRREHRLSTASDVSFTSDSSRRRAVDYTRDEERLKRATTSRSPVLDRSVLGTVPSSNHLQRRELENITVSKEEDYVAEPSVNVPSTWGSRARKSHGWIDSLKRNRENRTGSITDDLGEIPSQSKPESVPKVNGLPPAERKAVGETRPESLRYGLPSPPSAPTSPNQKEKYASGGQNIPNTPIVVFPSSTFNKRSPSKRDSQDLLRKLARNGSPIQNPSDATQTPEPTTIGRRIYDKTPVVTGAWIDTPVTQRPPASQPRDAIRTLGTSPSKSWGLEKLVEEASTADEQIADTEELSPNFEPPKEKVMGEKPAGEPLKESRTNESVKEEDRSESESKRSSLVPASHKSQGAGKDQKSALMPLPDHPKSALETVLEDHRSNKESLDVGDDTIESLQAIVDQQPTDDPKAEEADDTAYEQQVIEQLESAQSSDMKDFERIEGKLQSLADTMSHLKSGLNQLGNRVSRDTELIIASLTKGPVGPTDSKPFQLQKGCETCIHQSGAKQTSIPLPHLWDKGNVWWRPRPTLLGWCALIPLLWYWSESTMCDYYCHPFVSPSCEGNCLNLDAPRFPLVIPTMISRWFHLSDILIPLWTVLVALARFFGQVLGFWDGFVDDERPALNLTGKLLVEGDQMENFAATATPTAGGFIPPLSQWMWKQETHTPQPVPELDLGADLDGDLWDDISMDEDEFL
ncbi:uncharacterized protein BJX67DRAFT_353974 [Aspergillus lucknowensis]|uniref:Uncharacterized protein n=1 Tax=Aspergillus lucknowensis TaxID=176173 RepID=A0ABR4LSK1_9EURO